MVSLPTRQVILAFESSADQASAAIIADGIARQHVHAARHGHAALITELARAALEEAGLSAREVTHVAAGRGPGSFTGIRVALAAAKGFALAAGAEGIGVSCLAAMAQAARHSGQELADMRIVATVDTRRGSFFCQAFDPDGPVADAIVEMDGEPPLYIPESWSGAAIIGPGADTIISADTAKSLTTAGMAALDALQVGRLAACRMEAGTAPEPLTPLYVAPASLGPGAP
ncbi:MAG: tRNA (adenosine(37)-N6)-threonylcarbamoyltransferase complex dimerization subunit type 1 TsaB [Pseudomonadota bacterium]|nr:tRNA (adenosine(37)-N6)-threonylcarbamoyltransferase complex dimerization subunit type 1 TsaB [Pseudomonadota bacterium]